MWNDSGGQECDQDDSRGHGGRRGRSCRGWPVESLARPGGNVTGFTYLQGQLGGKRLEPLKEAVPKLADVAVLYDAASAGAALELKEFLPDSARALGLSLQPWEVRSTEDFDRVFGAMVKQRPDGLYARARRPANA